MATHDTKVVIIGAGVAGLTLASFLQTAKIDFILLEKRSRSYVETRQRAGVVDACSVQMFERWGLAEKLLAGPVAQTIDYRIDGNSRIFEAIGGEGSAGRFCTQQMLVNNLLSEVIDKFHGDARFEVGDVTILNEENQRPQVKYKDLNGWSTIVCDHIAGCDAARGVSRASIPDGVLTTYTHEFGYAWLAALVEAPLIGHPIMAVSNYGFAAQLPRGPARSRYYLQCNLSDGPLDWPDERIWDEIRLRIGNDTLENAAVLSKEFVPLRAVVHTPMQYQNLYLAGDAAHLVPPTGAKGMNLALYDIDILAQGLLSAVRDQDHTKLAGYTMAVLPRLWRYQEFSAWMTDTLHDAGNGTPQAAFARMTARARLDDLFHLPEAGHLHRDFLRGTA